MAENARSENNDSAIELHTAAIGFGAKCSEYVYGMVEVSYTPLQIATYGVQRPAWCVVLCA